MAIMEFPGVGYTEKSWDSSSAISGGATDICGVMILAEKGPINKPVLINNIDQAIEVFGSYKAGMYGMYSIKGFFQNGGRSLYVSRLAHYADITDAASLTMKQSSLTIKNAKTTPKDTLTFKSKYLGEVGNTYGIEVLDLHRASTTVATANGASGKELVCKVVRDFVVGEYVKISVTAESPLTVYAKIASINAATRTLVFEEDITQAIPVGSVVDTCDFTLKIYRKSISGPVLESTFVGCTLDQQSNFYVCNLVNSSSSGSTLVTCEDELLDEANVYDRLPAPISLTYLAGGTDGLDEFSDIDISGDSASKTGYYAFDKITDQIHVWCPESASKGVIRAGYDYWQARMTGMFFATVPSGLNPEKAAEFRDEAGWNTSYGVLYHNWGYVTDPIGFGDTPEKLIPLTGHVLGAMSKHDRTDVNLYGSAPAGESMVLLGVNRLEFEVDRTNGGIMYGNKNRNINPIVNLSNNGGIAVWGSRTQSTDPKWFQIHARRVFIYSELSIANGTRWATFQNKDDALYRKIQRVVKKFLGGVKGLAGDTDDERFEFVCDATINDPDDSTVNGRIGLNIVSVGEFIWFEFGQKPEGVSLAEI